MKKLFLLLIAGSAFSNMFAQKELTIYPASKPVSQDGIIDSNDPWNDAYWVVPGEITPYSTTTNLSAKFQLRYDNFNLYFAASVQDSMRFTGNSTTYMNDCVEFYVAMDTASKPDGVYRPGDLQMRVQAVSDQSSPGFGFETPVWPNAQVSVADNGTNYVEEWTIPWSDLTSQMESPWDQKQFKWDIQVADATDDGARTEQLFWNDNTDLQWNNTWHFGLITLDIPLFNLVPSPESDVIFDFETPGDDTSWTIFGNGSEQNQSTDLGIAWNPDSAGINKSGHALLYIVHSDAQNWAGMFTDDLNSPITITEDKHMLYVMVYKSIISPVLIKLESSSDGGPSMEMVKTPNTVTYEWELISFDASLFPEVMGHTYNRLTVFPDFPDMRTEESINYLDNISFGSESPTDKFFIELGQNRNIVCGDATMLNAYIGNKPGGTLTYSWSPATGLSATNIINPVADPKVTTKYVLSVTSESYGTAKDSVYVIVNPIIVTANDVIQECGGKAQLSALTNFVGTGVLSYGWAPSDGLSAINIRNPMASVFNETTYTVTVTTANGCKGTDDAKVTPIVTNAVPSICMVTVDENNHNVVVIKKNNVPGIDSFIIYRESNDHTNLFEPIGAVPYSGEAVFTDEGSDARVQSNRYRITIKDKCEFETSGGHPHKTIHLSGIGNYGNLVWEPYWGDVDIESYRIYRGTLPSELTMIGSVSGNNTSYTDLSFPEGTVYYQLEAVIPDPCASSLLKSSDHSGILSNIYCAGIKNSVGADQESYSFIYPNPAKDAIYLKGIGHDATICIYDASGRYLSECRLKNNQADIANLNKGLYILRAIDNKKVITGTFVKE
jgi:hypothetical protein